MRTLIYSAIFGDYDTLRPQLPLNDADYVCFTDKEKPLAEPWKQIIFKPAYHDEHPRITAKRFKCALQRYFDTGNYQYSIWIDGSMQIRKPEFLDICLKSLGRWGFALIKHPKSTCVYQEAKGCAHMQKYKLERIIEQVFHYKFLGMPGNIPIAAGGIVVRDLKKEILIKIGDEWLEQNLFWTFQDQLSLPYVLWKNNYGFDEIPLGLYDYNYFILNDHAHEL